MKRRPPLLTAHLLLVSDDQHELKRLTGWLKEESHACKVLPTSEAALLMATAVEAVQVVLIEDRSNRTRPSDALLLLQQLHFARPDLQIILWQPTADIEAQRLAFLAGACDVLSGPLHAESFKQSMRRAIEHHEIANASEEARLQLRLLERLRKISSFVDISMLRRLAADLIRHALDADAVGLYFTTAGDKRHTHFLPIHSANLDRRVHAHGANFLEALHKTHWRRFAKANVLRGRFRPWDLKRNFGKHNLLIPLRHREGLLGALLVSRQGRLRGFKRQEKQHADILGAHLARTIEILRFYESSQQSQFRDNLTGLFNQRYLQTYGEQELVAARQNSQELSLLMVNVLAFRSVNERHGHLAGGELLAQVANRLKAAFRDNDLLIRLEGDIFVALLRGSNSSTTRQIADRLVDQVEKSPLTTATGGAIHAKLSVSLATFPTDAHNLDELLIHARQQLPSSH